MAKTHLTIPETKEMFLHVSGRMIASKDLLTQADKAIGDGDHGIGMANGFEAVRAKLEENEFETLAEMMKAIGMALMTNVGGASGAIFGTMYLGAAKGLGDKDILDAEALFLYLSHGLEAVKKRGKAKLGDKTMVDALEPAAEASEMHREADLEAALTAVAQAALGGVESTKDMVAVMGRAKSLGDRALGHPDPGAVSTHLIFSFMLDHIT